MKLVVIIVNKGEANEIVSFVEPFNIMSPVTFIGKGTASSEILEALSLVQTDKEVIFAFVEKETPAKMFKELEEKFEFTKKGMGIAFAVNLSGITQKTLDAITTHKV